MEEERNFEYSAHSEYMDDMNYSQGFYVTKRDDGWTAPGTVRRVDDPSDERFAKAVIAAEFAVAERNKSVEKKGRLTFLKIVNLNVEPTAGALYYITASLETSAGQKCLYHMKIWQTIRGVYKVRKFDPAPYWLSTLEKYDFRDHRVTMKNLLPWMDEGYLYYKCLLAPREIRGVEKVGDNEAHIWFKSISGRDRFVDRFCRYKMPGTDILCTFVY